MMKRVLATLALILAFQVQAVVAQDYVQPPITVSRDKIRDSEGRLYYSHVVLEKQTLFSIAKAYGVTVDQICDANREFDLRNEGLRKNTILRIPIVSEGETSSKNDDKASEQESKTVQVAVPQDNARIHVVKWFESLEDIAAKYGVSSEAIAAANGLKNGKVKTRMKLVIPEGETAVAELEEAVPAAEEDDSAAQEKGGEGILDRIHGTIDDFFDRFAPRKEVNAMLILPFSAAAGPNVNSFDFYSGFLMGIRDLGQMGISTNLQVYDARQGRIPVGAKAVSSNDLVIGPISSRDLGNLLAIDSTRTPVVSPLDHKAGVLTEGRHHFIQAPTSYDVQYEDMVDWIRHDLSAGDKVLMISEKGAASTELPARMDALLRNSGVEYTPYSYSILQGRNVGDALASLMGKGVNRVIIASESEAFVNDVVRNLNQLVFRKHEIVLYSSSRIRAYNTIDVENLHNLRMHASLSYNIDYDSPQVKRFLLEYRALYGTEPTQFSFQGYDIARFFIAACAEYGRGWLEKLASMNRMQLLQNDFLFAEEEDGGFVNQGIRRVVYTTDYKIESYR